MRSWFIYEFSNFLYSKFGRPPRIETMPKELRKYVNLSGGNVKEKLIEIEEKEIKKELSQIEEKERDKFIQSEIEKINTKSLANIEEKEIKVRNVKRNHRLYALLKEKYNHQCQICNFTFKKKDGKNYCEACHIEQLSKSRLDNEENILILCSNCHKKLDLGDKTSKKDILEFINSRILEKIS